MHVCIHTHTYAGRVYELSRLLYGYTHTHTHSHIHTDTYSRTNTHAHVHTHAYPRTRTHAQKYAHIDGYVLMCAQIVHELSYLLYVF